MLPRVSAVTPVYNGEAYLREAMDSVLEQTFRDFEFIVIDDGSTDGSVGVVQSYRDPRIRLLRNETNTGLAAVRNRGMAEARGEFIAWLDCDDASLPGRFEQQVRCLDRRPQAVLCGTWVRTIGSGTQREWHYPTEPEFLRGRMLFDSPIATSSVMMRRQLVVDRQFRFDAAYPPAEDYDLWERLSRDYQIYNLGEVLTLYRTHPNQTSIHRAEMQNDAIWSVQLRLLGSLEISPTEEEKSIHLDIGVRWKFAGTRDSVLRARDWLEKLDHANKRTRAFPQPAFQRVLIERWLSVCQAATREGMFAWSTFWKSSLSEHAKFPPFARQKFFAKSILKFDRHAAD